MRIPKKLKAAGFDYDVKLQDELVLYGQEVGGQVSFRDGEIILSRKGKPHCMEAALVHEIVHTINDSIEAVRMFFKSPEDEEDFTHCFGRALYGFLKDNVKEIEWKGRVFTDVEVNRPAKTETRVS